VQAGKRHFVYDYAGIIYRPPKPLQRAGDIIVGTAIANRNGSEIEELIGFFVNTLALRIDLSGI